MTAEQFVKVLGDAMPTAEALRARGIKSIERFQRAYQCTRRPSEGGLPMADDAAVDLVSRWDCGSVEIGMVSFYSNPKQVAGGVHIGDVEADPLIVQKKDGRVVAVDLAKSDHLLWKLAENGAKLLDALAIAARFLEDRGMGKIDFNDFNAAKAAATKCAELAGGSEYGDFYMMLLGAEE